MSLARQLAERITACATKTSRRRPSYDSLNDFEYVAMYARTPVVLVVNPALPVKTVSDLIDYARSRQGKVKPKGTPRAIIEKVNAAVIKIVNTQEVRDQFAFQGAETATSTPGEYRKAVQEESLSSAGRSRPQD